MSVWVLHYIKQNSNSIQLGARICKHQWWFGGTNHPSHAMVFDCRFARIFSYCMREGLSFQSWEILNEWLFVPIFFFNYSNLPQIIFGEIFFFLWHCSSPYFLTNNHSLFHELCFRESSGTRMKWIYLMWGDLYFHVICFQIQWSMCFDTYFYILIFLLNIMVTINNVMFKYLK